MQDVQKEIGKRIRELRRKKGFSQEGFADACGMHRAHMGQIERGETNLTLSTILTVTRKLEITPSTLFRNLQ